MKKSRYYPSVLVVLFFLVACGSPKIYTDYDETKDFNEYRSFSFYKDIESGLDTLDQARFQKALKANLEEKNFTPRKKPDFYINFYADYTEETNRNNLGISIGTFGTPIGGNIASGIPILSQRKFMTLTVELVDAKNNTLYWQGVAETRLKKNRTPEERTTFFNTIAKTILKDYPPK